MNRLILGIVSLFCFSLLLSSCKLLRHKKSKKKKQETAVQVHKIDSLNTAIKSELAITDAANALKGAIDSIAPIWQKRNVFKTLSTKSRMHYEGADKVFDFVANIRMRQDSLIWVSVTVAGIVQVARAIITPDSFKVVLYTEKEAYQGPISKVNEILPEGIDFFSLQNLLLGNPILQNVSPVSVGDENNNWLVRLLDKNYIEQLQFAKADSTLVSSQLLTQGEANQSISHFLSNFGLFSDLKIATDRRINLISGGSSTLVEMNLSNITINDDLTYPFSIPKNYTLK
jgi:hypothetical protein